MRTIAGTTWRVEDAQQYIHDRTMIVPWSGCWLWERALNDNGYGLGHAPRPTVQGEMRRFKAHRLAYEAFVGPIPPGDGCHGTVVMHTCDVRACCNPDHLRLGAQRDNVVDMVSKGRNRPPRGTAQSSAKLTDEDVRVIRQSTDGIRELARRFGVAHPQIIRIKSGRGWRHVR